MKKVGIIRCRQTESYCAATSCIKVSTKGMLAFEKYGPCELIGINSCGGCPGKEVALRAENLVKKGAEIIALATCMSKGAPIGFPCPHFEQIKASVTKRLGDAVEIVDYTH